MVDDADDHRVQAEALAQRVRVLRGRAVREALRLYSSCYAEATRQVSVHCVERGQLLVRVWRGAQTLWREVVALVEEGASAELAQAQARRAQCEKRVAALESQVLEEAGLWADKYEQVVAARRDLTERCTVLTKQAKRDTAETRRLREMLRQLLAQQMSAGTSGKAGVGFGPNVHGAAGANIMAEIMAAAFGAEVGSDKGLQVLRLRMGPEGRVYDVHAPVVLRSDARRSEVLNQYFEVAEDTDGSGGDGGSDNDSDEEAMELMGDPMSPSYDPVKAARAMAARPRKQLQERHQGPRVEGGGRALGTPDDDGVFDLGVECVRFPDVLDFMFTGKVLLTGMDEVQELRTDAESLGMAALEAACTERIKQLRAQTAAGTLHADEQARKAAGAREQVAKLLHQVRRRRHCGV